MSTEKKKSGCIGTMFKAVVIVFAIGIIAALLVPRDESSSTSAQSSPDVASSQSPPPPRTDAQTIQEAAPKPEAPKFDILSVADHELPPTTRITKATEFSIAGGQGRATAAAGSEVKVLSLSGDKIEVSYLDSKLHIPYSETTIENDVTALREEKARIEAERKAEEERVRIAKEQAEQAAAAEKDARRKQIERHFSSWDGSHNGLTRQIKKSMNDPGSYKHEETRFIDQGDTLLVITSFRGKNAFGALVKNTVTAQVDLDGNVLQIISQE